MSVDLALEAARECSYCARGASSASPLVADGEGGWMHADPAGCLVETTRIAGVTITLDALAAAPRESAPPPGRAAQTDAGILLGGGEIDPADLDERERVARALRGLPHLAGARALGELAAASVAARAGVEASVAWETRCNALRGARARRGRQRR